MEVPRTSCMAVIKRLDPVRKYFPMVSQTGDRTLYAQPPEPVQPGQVPAKFPELSPKKSDGDEHNEIWDAWEENELPSITKRTLRDYLSRATEMYCKVSLVFSPFKCFYSTIRTCRANSCFCNNKHRSHMKSHQELSIVDV